MTIKSALDIALEKAASMPVPDPKPKREFDPNHEHSRWGEPYCPTFTEDPEHYGYEEIAYESGGGYDWSAVGVWRRLSDNGLFWYGGGGCSCNGPDDDLPHELEPLPSLETLLRHLFDIGKYDIDGAAKVDIMRRVSAVL